MSEDEFEEGYKEYMDYCYECCLKFCGDDLGEIMGEEVCPGCPCTDICEEFEDFIGIDWDDDWEEDWGDDP